MVDLGSCLLMAYSLPPMLVFISVPKIDCSPIPTSGLTSNANLEPIITSDKPVIVPLIATRVQYCLDADVNSLNVHPIGKVAVIATDLASNAPLAEVSCQSSKLSVSIAVKLTPFSDLTAIQNERFDIYVKRMAFDALLDWLVKSLGIHTEIDD